MDFLCVRCARHRKTCCQTCEVHATLGDVRRIAAHTGLHDVTEFRAPADPAYADQDDDPAWGKYVFRRDGTRRILKKQANGDCLFLGPQGCRLPLEVRPLICRMYPFDYTEVGIKAGELAEGCPLELVRPELGLIGELGMNVDDARRWHQQLYQEIREEGEDECTSA